MKGGIALVSTGYASAGEGGVKVRSQLGAGVGHLDEPPQDAVDPYVHGQDVVVASSQET